MNLFRSHFRVEELVLCAILLTFFLWIFLGAFSFEPSSALLPKMLSLPGIVLMVLYVLRGYLPEVARGALSADDQFAIGKLQDPAVQGEQAREAVDVEDADQADESDVLADSLRAPAWSRTNSAADLARMQQTARTYFVLGFSALFPILAYGFGFYVSTVLSITLYMVVVRRSVRHPVLMGCFLIALLLAFVYVFDLAFHFERGVWLPDWLG